MAIDETSLAESAQALFCAMADFVGAAKVKKIFDTDVYPDYKSFKKNWDETYPNDKIGEAFKKHVDSNVTNLKSIEEFLNKTTKNKVSEWYLSSVEIAKTVILEIDDISTKFTSIKKPSWSSIFYVRGDKVVMNNIEILFKEAVISQKQVNDLLVQAGEPKKLIFGDVNKWSPADIYFASPKAKKDIADLVKNKTGLTFQSLNLFVAKMIASGDLLPLSLKKQPHKVTIHKVNFSRPYELKELQKIKAYGLSNWKPNINGNNAARNLEVYLSQDKVHYLQLLHVIDDSGGWKANNMIRGSKARHGSLGSQHVFHDALAIIDKPFASVWLNKFTALNNTFKKELKEFVRKELKGIRPKGPPKGSPPKTPKTKERILFEEKREELSINMTNKMHPVFISWYKKGDNADKFSRVIYEYVASRSDDSGPFIIAK
jgi:hypothetical protein